MANTAVTERPEPISRLSTTGQSVWLDFIRRSFIDSGDLQRYVDEGWITGLTSNPSIFAKAIAGSSDYDAALTELAASGVTEPYEAFVHLATEDIRRAADLFLPVYRQSDKRDGYVSLETPPGIENDANQTVAEARRLFALVDRPNVLIKVPGTDAGIQALEELISDGINVNVTLIFDIDTYQRVAEAYIRGLEKRKLRDKPVRGIASVASFFISRIDAAVDMGLPQDSEIRGLTAIANARAAYEKFEELFLGRRWSLLAEAGAMVQRPLWASTSTKDPAFSDVLYVDELAGANTVNTMPETTLRAFADHGDGTDRMGPGRIFDAHADLDRLAATGIDLKTTTQQLLVAGLNSFEQDFNALLESIRASLSKSAEGSRGLSGVLHADSAFTSVVSEAIKGIKAKDVVRRIWRHDHTVWADNEREITDRLGWLTVAESLAEQVNDLNSFASDVWADGIQSIVLLGMGGSSLAPEVLADTFGNSESPARLYVLDTTDSAAIRAVEESVDLKKTLFIAASKSGSTIETLTQLDYFWSKIPDGSHFVVITDPGSGLAEIGKERGFRRVFLNQPDIGGRYSALSHFGMVPAALVGIDIAAVLDTATTMECALDGCVPVEQNPGVTLGVVLGEAALTGRDKVTIIVPQEIETFGKWAEQLLAESTGKEGRGIVPIEGEPLASPDIYGQDRLFVVIGEHPEVKALIAAGHPVFQIPFIDRNQLGAEFLRWEYAAAIASHLLGIHPFDQPNVQEAKDITAEILGGATYTEDTPSGSEVLDTVASGEYIAILAYLPRNETTSNQLQKIRLRLRAKHKVATTVGFGPRSCTPRANCTRVDPIPAFSCKSLETTRKTSKFPAGSSRSDSLKRRRRLGICNLCDQKVAGSPGSRLINWKESRNEDGTCRSWPHGQWHQAAPGTRRTRGRRLRPRSRRV